MPHLESQGCKEGRFVKTLVKLRCSCARSRLRQRGRARSVLGADEVNRRRVRTECPPSANTEDLVHSHLVQWQNNAGGQSNLLSTSPQFLALLIPLSRTTRRLRLARASSTTLTSNPRRSLGAMPSPTPSRVGAVFSPTSCSSTLSSCLAVFGNRPPSILRRTSHLSQTSYTRSRIQITTD